MLDEKVRQQVAETARRMATLGLAPGTSGNVSARAADGRFAVTPTGMDHATLSAADIVVIDASGDAIAGDLLPTSELPMHLAVYRARPDVAAIVHTHSPMATTMAVLGEDLPAVHYALAVAGTVVRCARYATYGSPELAANALEALGANNAALLANHGAVAVGPSPARALTVAEAVEFVAGLYWRARCIGSPHVIGHAEMARVAGLFETYGQPPKRPG